MRPLRAWGRPVAASGRPCRQGCCPQGGLLPGRPASGRWARLPSTNDRTSLRVATLPCVQNVLKVAAAFSWDAERGGRAFDFTIASLRRKHMNLKALFYPVYSELPLDKQ